MSLKGGVISGGAAASTPALGLPDVVVDAIRWSDDDGQTWNALTTDAPSATNLLFQGDVRNQGTAATPEGVILGLTFLVAGQVVTWSDTYTTALPVSQSVTLTANGGPSGSSYWLSQTGTFTITADADRPDRFAEINDANNTLSGMLTVVGSQQVSESPFQVTWIGNSLPGLNTPINRAYIQENAWDGFIWTDGRVFCNTSWSESSSECGVYQNGQEIGKLANIHMAGTDFNGGGNAIVGNGTHTFAAVWGGGTQFGIVKHNMSTYAGVNITGGPTRRNINNYRPAGGQVFGLAIVGSEVFASISGLNRVEVYNTSNLTFLRQFSVTAPQKIVADAQGRLWIVTQNQVRAYNTSGTYLGLAITNVAVPTALGRDWTDPDVILVGDDGQNAQQVYIYDITGTPTRVETIGTAGGVWAGPIPGATGELRFAGPTGVGIDSAGKLYVVQDHRTDDAIGTGTNIDVYLRAGGSWARDWQALGLLFIDVCAVDLSTYQAGQPLDVYSTDEHFKFDLTAPVGSQWTWVGVTTNRWGAPSDPRFQGPITDHGRDVVVDIRVLDGHTFMFTSNGVVSIRDKPIYRKQANSEIWVYTGVTISLPRNCSGNMAANGDIWIVDFDQTGQGGSIKRYPYQGLNGSNNPIYGTAVSYSLPTGFNLVKRVSYDSALGQLFVAGFTPANPAWTGMGKIQGTWLARIDNWLTGNRTPLWSTMLEHVAGETVVNNFRGTMCIAPAADRVYVCSNSWVDPNTDPRQISVWAYNRDTGTEMAEWLPGAVVGHNGLVDVYDGMTATALPNGEVIIFIEEDGLGKNVVHRIQRS